MFGIGDVIKNVVTNNLDIAGIAEKLISLIPDGNGKKAMALAMSIAKNGGSPRDVKNALENMLPGAKEKLAGNQIWNNIPEDKDGIVSYGQNVAKQFQILK